MESGYEEKFRLTDCISNFADSKCKARVAFSKKMFSLSLEKVQHLLTEFINVSELFLILDLLDNRRLLFTPYWS